MSIMDSFHCVLFVVFAVHANLLAFADRKFGCLFEAELCSPYEVCSNDGVFGRCQNVPVTEVYTYDVPPSALLRLRTLLQKLSHRGLTWEDDTAQQAISKELSKLRRVSYGLPESSLSRLPGSTDSGNRKLKMEEEAELGRSLKYLQRLGLLPQAAPPAPPTGPRTNAEMRQNDGLPAGRPLKVYAPAKAQAKGKGRDPDDRSDDGRLLLAALQRYLAQKPAPGPALSPAPYSSRPRPFPSSPKESADGYHGRPPLGQGSADRPKQPRPAAQRLLFRPGTSQPPAKGPLSLVDEKFIQSVVTQLGKHDVNVEALNGAELDQLADVIANALQVVDEDGGGGGGAGGPPGNNLRDSKRGPASVAQPDQQGALQEDDALNERQMSEEKPNSDDKDAGLINKLLEYLDKNNFGDAQLDAGAAKEAELGAGPAVGVENVKSRTTRKDLAVQKKDDDVPLLPAPVAPGDRGLGGGAPAGMLAEPRKKDMRIEQELELDVKTVSAAEREADYGYIITDSDSLPTDQALHLMELLAHSVRLQMTDFLELSVVGSAVTFKVHPNPQNVSTADVANAADQQKNKLEKETGIRILEAGVTEKSMLDQIPTKYNQAESTKFLILTVVSIVCIVGVLVASTGVYCMRHRSHHKLKEKLTRLGTDTGSDATSTYQELCRQRMAVRTAERAEPVPMHSSRINSVSSQFSDGPLPSPSVRSSTSSWSEEPAHSNMDISTGHMILSYMEDHLKNKNRLEKEWEALCAYQAEPNACAIAQRDGNAKKNRANAALVYDHSRITLKPENNQGNSDYINASPIMDHDPRSPAYIATQGPLPSTVADFWQMVWENGCVVIVMLTPLTENAVKQSYHYWPDEGSNLYHIYEVNLVSEHIWCEDFLVRSFYLKNMQTNETRTVTQFHFLTWLNQNVPESSRTLLDFRRKVNKCYRGRSCPIIVHCSDGAGRSGTYILIDMVLNKMAKGAKEIDIAATLEHLRDQRPGMVQTKEQFEFALTAVAEEVNAILKALPQ
ncbi:receptor-type tyrosine-protein phosphatase N2-like isoform X1 [Anguilla rostrata]|uniref:receptor-type tyrosine-protein phosphatase N2-like isoform X1 n=1 Tax=Anguilla rostrata TaxID=7938 RepID=UPI0030CAB68C